MYGHGHFRVSIQNIRSPQDDYMSICHIVLVTVNHLFLPPYKPTVADVPGVGPVPLRAAPPHPRVPAEHRLPLPRDALPAARAHRNGENVQYRVELKTNLCEDFTILGLLLVESAY